MKLKVLIVSICLSTVMLSGCGMSEEFSNALDEQKQLIEEEKEKQEEKINAMLSGEDDSKEESESENEDSQTETESPEKDSTQKVEPQEEATESKQTEDEDPGESFVEKYDNEIVVSAKMVLDRFISDYKISLAPQLWTIADFDDKGAVIAMIDIENSSGQTENAIVVLTPIMENDKMTGSTPHYVSVGSTVYGDDGYCDDVFDKIKNIGK